MAARHDLSPKALTAARRHKLAQPKTSGRGSGLTPRVKKAVELFVFGFEDDKTASVSIASAAEASGLTDRALRAAWQKPAVQAYYQQQMALLRNGEKPASIRTIAAIRDDTGLKNTAAGQRVRLEAAKAFVQDDLTAPATTNIMINNTIETPGYVIDLSEFVKPEPPHAYDEPRIPQTIDAIPNQDR